MSGGLNRRGALRLLASASTIAGVAAASPALALADGAPVYKLASAPIAMRVRDLLARMTLEEKAAQMIALWATKKEVMVEDGIDFDPARATKAYPNGFGQITRPSDRRGGLNVPEVAGGTGARFRGTASTVKFVNDIQRWALEKTRLGIPVLFHEESLHGYVAPDSTLFPQAIALAGSFDRDLITRVQSKIGQEVRAHGARLALSPVVDISRDPRWGRIEETFGEDPYLCGEMGVAAVLGLQGRGEKLADDKVFATLKHMTGHGQPQSGENVGPAPLSRRELRENFFPPFQAVVSRTDIAAVMPSYNEIDGVPSHANKWLLGDVLRDEWHFHGMLVSDYEGVEQLETLHHVAGSQEEAAIRAVAAGVDCDLPDGLAYRHLPDLVRAGRVSRDAIDRACARILEIKFRAGLFDNPYADLAHAQTVTGDAKGRALALEAARRSLCLLTNDGTLPLSDSAYGTVAVIGPNAAVPRFGGYSGNPRQAISPLDGIRTRLGKKAKVVHAQGVHITTSEDRRADEITLGDPTDNRRLIAEAVETARGADVIILAIGGTEQTSREGYADNHRGDRASLGLLSQQNELFDAMMALGKPLVVCAINGRPPSWPEVAAKAPAMLECWYAGQEGGTAIAEALFGDINPGAKLPVTVARDVGQLPMFYDHKPSAHRGYLFTPADPLFPFGHGLSYTSFDLSAPRLSSPQIGTAGNVTVEVDVTNTGKRAGDEVVQLYLGEAVASVTRPVKRLRNFERVTLNPGEKRTVRFTVGPDDLALWNRDMEFVVEPGAFQIMTGPNSVDLKMATLTVA